jgi:hypothetical protein
LEKKIEKQNNCQYDRDCLAELFGCCFEQNKQYSEEDKLIQDGEQAQGFQLVQSGDDQRESGRPKREIDIISRIMKAIRDPIIGIRSQKRIKNIQIRVDQKKSLDQKSQKEKAKNNQNIIFLKNFFHEAILRNRKS